MLSLEITTVPNEAVRGIPPGFDLELERRRIHREGASNLSKDRFFQNAWTYAKEHLAKVSNTSFADYVINEDASRYITLTTPEYQGLVRELYNPNRSDWPLYRKSSIQLRRAQAEYEGFSRFEASDELRNAQVGDIFIWTSPPPSDFLAQRDFEGLKNNGYGFHSFTFVYEVKVKDDKRYLESKAIRHYLDPKRQEQLLALISGELLFDKDYQPSDIDLLKRIVKGKRGYTIEIVRHYIDKLYKETPDHEKIIPPIVVQNLSEEAVNKILSGLNSWLSGIFYLMYFDESKENDYLIEKQFHGWENAVKTLLNGEEINSSEFNEIIPQYWATYQVEQYQRLGFSYFQNTLSMCSHYANMDYQPESGNCGIGSSFGSKRGNLTYSGSRFSLTTTYESVTSPLDEDKPFTGECPVCKAYNIDLPKGGHCWQCDTEYQCG